MRFIIALSFAISFSLSATIAPSLLSRISFFSKIPDREINPEYKFTHGNTSSTCTQKQNLQINVLNDQIVTGFFLESGKNTKKPSPLVKEEVETLSEIAQRRFSDSLDATSRNSKDECENMIAKLEGHLAFLLTIYKKGYAVSRNEEVYNLLSKKALNLSSTFELVEFMAKNLLNIHYLGRLNAKINQDSGFALFLFTKTFETNDILYPNTAPATRDVLFHEYSKMLLSYQRYLDIISVATISKSNTSVPVLKNSDYFAAYVELDLIEKNPEHLSLIRNLSPFNTRAYIATLLKMAELFPDFVTSSEDYRDSFSKIFMAEELANIVAKEKVSARTELMALIPITKVDEINKLSAASGELRPHILNNTKNDTLGRADRMRIASHILRLSRDIVRTNPVNMVAVARMREDLQKQLNDGKSIALVNVNAKLAQGI